MSRAEIVETLNVYVEPKKIFRFFSEHTAFEGTVTQAGFKISRIINGRNSFLPVIIGKFATSQSGITVAVKMRLHAFVAVFLCFWFGGVGVGILDFLAALVTGRDKNFVDLSLVCCMLIFGYVLVMASFWSEVKKAKQLLKEMFR